VAALTRLGIQENPNEMRVIASMWQRQSLMGVSKAANYPYTSSLDAVDWLKGFRVHWQVIKPLATTRATLCQ